MEMDKIFFFPQKSKSKKYGSHQNLLDIFNYLHCSYSLLIWKTLSEILCPAPRRRPKGPFISGPTNPFWHPFWLWVTRAQASLTSVVLTTRELIESPGILKTTLAEESHIWNWFLENIKKGSTHCISPRSGSHSPSNT